jgi:hypothetical protein
MMEVISSSETSVLARAIRRNIQEDGILHNNNNNDNNNVIEGAGTGMLLQVVT